MRTNKNVTVRHKKQEGKMKKFIAIVLALCLLTAMMAACGGNTTETTAAPGGNDEETTTTTKADDSSDKGETDEAVKLTYYSTSAEVNTMFEEMFVRYNEINPNVTIELIPTGVGQGQSEKLQSLYASGNAPTFMNVDPSTALEYQEHLAVFGPDEESWLELINNEAIDAGTFDGSVYGVGFSTQGYALIYNKRAVEEVIPDFDHTTIQTRDDLEEFFITLDAAGLPPTMLHGANWSLGAHYLGLTYAVQSPETEGGKNFIAGLIKGEIDIGEDELFNGYMDTLDLLIKYNYNKADPLVADINMDDQALAQGKAATYFMGDWIWAIIGPMEDRDEEFGFIPVPWSNDPEAYGNTEVVVNIPKIMSVNASQSTPEQQKAAFDCIEWMLTDPEGQKYFTDAGFAMPVKNLPADVEYSSATESIREYIERGKTLNINSFIYMTGDAWAQTGDLMLQYMVGAIDRRALADGINAYWQNQEIIE